MVVIAGKEVIARLPPEVFLPAQHPINQLQPDTESTGGVVTEQATVVFQHPPVEEATFLVNSGRRVLAWARTLKP